MEKIVKFVECLLPVTACNLKCSYCYVIQESRRAMKIPPLQYSLDTIQRALRKERFGGTCYFSICGAGETLMPDYIVDLVGRILDNGHYVNITSNGTLSRRYQQMMESYPQEQLSRLHFAFSLHWIELKHLNMLDRFFDNVRLVRGHGCSVVVQLNMCDEYMPHLDEIKERCKQEIGAWPQIAATRREDGFPVKRISLYTDRPEEEYIAAGKSFDSPLFDFTIKNFMVRRHEFCYAGDWSYQLNLQTGLLKRCYCSCVVQNIFKNTENAIFKMAVGHACNSLYCNNSSHFMSLGVIPEIDSPSYAELRNRPEAEWYTPEMNDVLSGKLSETNSTYGTMKKLASDVVGLYDKAAYKAYEMLLVARRRKEKTEKA